MIDYSVMGPLADMEAASGLIHGDVNVGFPIFHVDRYGADPRGKKDSTQAIQEAIDACYESTPLDSDVPAYTWIQGVQGGTVRLGRGWYRVDNTLTLRNRVSLQGDSYTASCIVAGDGFSDGVMIDAVDGTTPIFDSRIEKLRCHANNISGLDILHAQAWQEGCGLYQSSFDGFTSADGVVISDVSSGAARLEINQCNFGPFSSAERCVHVTSAVPNAFMMAVSNSTFNPSGSCDSCIQVDRGRFYGENIHVETCTNGVYGTAASIYINNITGGGSVANLINLEGAYPARVRVFMADKNGGTNTVLHGASAVTAFLAFYAVGAD